MARVLAKMLQRSNEKHEAGEPIEAHRARQAVMCDAGAVKMVHAMIEKAPSEGVLDAAFALGARLLEHNNVAAKEALMHVIRHSHEPGFMLQMCVGLRTAANRLREWRHSRRSGADLTSHSGAHHDHHAEELHVADQLRMMQMMCARPAPPRCAPSRPRGALSRRG